METGLEHKAYGHVNHKLDTVHLNHVSMWRV